MYPNNTGIRSVSVMMSMPMSKASFGFSAFAASERIRTESFIQDMNFNRARDHARTVLSLVQDPGFTGNRSLAPKRAWEYERERIRRGFRGTRRYTPEEKECILKYGKLTAKGGFKGAEVHHPKNVKAHPYEQANPDNSRICKNLSEHLEEHGGNFRHETDKPIRKDWQNKDLRNKTENRIAIKEFKLLTFQAILSFFTAASITYILERYQNGDSEEAKRQAVEEALKQGTDAMGITVMSLVLSNRLLAPAVDKISGLLAKLGLNVGAGAIEFGVVGAIALAVTSVYMYAKYRFQGYGRKEALIAVGKQAVAPAIFLIVGVVLAALFGTGAAIMFSLIVTFAMVGYNIYAIHQEKELQRTIAYGVSCFTFVEAGNAVEAALA